MKINKLAMITSKLIELLHWLAVLTMLALAIYSAIAGTQLGKTLEMAIRSQGMTLNTYGFEVTVLDGSGSLDIRLLLLFSLAAAVILSLMAMAFRNIHLILKKTENTTPFQKDNIRMVREIGIFFISVPLVGLFMSFIMRLAAGADIEVSMNMSGLMTGLVVLCLAQVFSHGTELEKEVDGLL